MNVKSISLFYSDLATGGTSDKVYVLHLVKQGNSFSVRYQNGRRGGTLTDKALNEEPLSLEQANKLFESKLNEKLRGGYLPPKNGIAAAAPILAAEVSLGQRTPYPIEDLVEIASAHESDVFLNSKKYWLQTKNDGEFRQIQKLPDGTFLGFNKEGNVVKSLPHEIVYELKKMKGKTFFLAGELIGNRFISENLLELNGDDLCKKTYAERFEQLEYLILANARHVTLTATWRTHMEKLEGMKALLENRCEGGVYKLITAQYRPGSGRQHYKYKFTKTLSAVVIGLGHKGHNSATLALYAAGGKMIEVGRCSLNGKPKVDVGTIVECRYLYATEGKRLYQPRMERIRTDVPAQKCTVDQLIYKQGVEA